MSATDNRQQVAILGYHKIGPPAPGGWESWFYVPEAIFMDQLRYLREHGWQAIDLATFLRGLSEPECLPKRAALITFDDGYRSALTAALPCLQQCDYPGVLFVPTDFIGGTNAFDGGMEPTEPICDWDDLRTLERGGVSVQSHSGSHRTFSELEPATQEEELLRPKAVLETGLNKRVEVFAFPYGDAGSDPLAMTQRVKRAGYRAACLYGGGPNLLPGADAWRLTRLAMGPNTDLESELKLGLEEAACR